MSGLPREVLKWIQGLDLSYSVRNVKRDFSNGFMIAEILSRYYPSDITMHSFDNGSSIDTKQDNWTQLKRFFKKISFTFNEEEIKNMIHCQTNSSAIPIVNRLYEAITSRKLKHPTKKNLSSLQEITPSYAYPTAANTLTEKLRGTDTNKSDVVTTQQTAKSVIADHEQAMLKRKLQNTQKFNAFKPQSHKNRDIARGPTKTVESNKNEIQQVSFIKDIQIKKVSESLLTIRNNYPQMNTTHNHERRHSKANSKKNDHTHSIHSQSLKSPTQSNAATNVLLSPKYESINLMTIDDIFRQCIQTAARNQVTELEFSLNQKNILNEFFKHFNDPSIEQQLIELIQHLQDEIISQCAESSLSSPREFWRMNNIFNKAFESNQVNSTLFNKWLQFAKSFSNMIYEVAKSESDNENLNNINNNNIIQEFNDNEIENDNKSVDLIFELFLDYGLPSLLALLKCQPKKRYYLLSYIISFIHNPNQHVLYLKRLQNEMNQDIDTFISICAVLLQLCKDLNILINDELLDIYAYYAINGLTRLSPKIRAASLNILTNLIYIVPNNDALDIVVPCFQSQIMSMTSNDNWWEIDAQLIILSSVLLSKFNINHELSPSIHETIIYLLKEKNLCRKVLRIAITHLSKPECIGQHAPIHEVYTNILLNNNKLRMELISDKNFYQSDMFSFGVWYKTQWICNLWKGWIVCQNIAKQLKQQNLGNFLPTHLQLILPAICETKEFEIEDIEQWKQVFIELKDYLLVELCDQNSCVFIAECLHKFLNNINIIDEAIKLLDADINKDQSSVPALFGVLKLLFPNGPQICQETVFNFLQDLLTISSIGNDNNSDGSAQNNPASQASSNTLKSQKRIQDATRSLLSVFYKKCPIQFSQSILRNLKDEINQQ